MSSPKAIVYDLGVALSSIALWVVPVDTIRAIGYATSIVFSARGYYTGITLLAKERKDDEIEAMAYDAGVDFHERLLESSLELKLQQLENRFTEHLIPLAAEKSFLDRKLTQALGVGQAFSEAEKTTVAKEAIDSAFTVDEDLNDSESSLTEEELRKTFPEHADSTMWKAILKALANGSTRNEIIKDVLEVKADVGNAYLDLLKSKYL